MPERIESKHLQFENLCGREPDILYLLSGISEATSASGKKKYKPGAFGDLDWKGFMSPGKARALAVVELAEAFPKATVAVNSNTFNILNPQAPTDAEVMAEYLKQKGISPGRMIKQDRSTTTFTELVELVKYFDIYNWEHVVVVAGETQRPRAEEMFRQIKTLHDPSGAWKDSAFQKALNRADENRPTVAFISAEEILQIRDERYAKLLVLARNTAIWKTREELDQQGLQALKEGNYWPK